MISKKSQAGAPDEAYVWIWLPGAIEPVVAGLITRDGERYVFNYGRSYLDRPNAIAIFEPELPLRRGVIPPILRCRWRAACATARQTLGVAA